MGPHKSPTFHHGFLGGVETMKIREGMINARNAICSLGLQTHIFGQIHPWINGEKLWKASSQHIQTLYLWKRQLATALFVEVDIG
jgi:hypothetical protein